jgi:hypothetical protein
VFSVSGIFGSDDDWNAIVGKWTERLEERIFHATECDSDLGDFAPRNPDDPEDMDKTHKANKTLYKDLTILLTESKLLGYVLSMDLCAYREFFPKADDPNDPYYFCFYGVVENFALINSVCIPRDKVKFTFDQQTEIEHNASALYHSMLQLPEWNGFDLLADEIGYTSRRNPKIQAADLVAREGMKRLDNRIGPITRVPRRSMLALEGTKRFKFSELGREYFRTLVGKTNLLRDLPGADAAKYQQWLENSRITDNTSNRIRYHNFVISQIQRPAQKP